MNEAERIPPAYAAPCEFCDGLVDVRAPGTHQWTSGWVKQRAEGGGHAIALRVTESRWAHSVCVETKARGDRVSLW